MDNSPLPTGTPPSPPWAGCLTSNTDGRAADAAAQDLGAHAREHQLCQPLHVVLHVLHAQPEGKGG